MEPERASTVLIVSADRFEDSELLEPMRRMREAGMDVHVASTRMGRITGKHGQHVEVDRATQDVDAAEYDLLLLPGGDAPAGLSRDAVVLRLVRSFMADGKPVAAICHGPQILAAAGVLGARRATSAASVADQLRAAGTIFEDREVVVDQALITSRRPADLPAFIDAVVRMLRPA
jgi:protease I